MLADVRRDQQKQSNWVPRNFHSDEKYLFAITKIKIIKKKSCLQIKNEGKIPGLKILSLTIPCVPQQVFLQCYQGSPGSSPGRYWIRKCSNPHIKQVMPYNLLNT